jgi:nitrogen-specific signal transduction histidine kinase
MMNYPTVNQELLERVISHLREKGMNLSLEDLSTGVNILKDEILYQFVKEFVNQIEKIIAIDPSLTEKEILQIVAKNMVDYLGAQVASMRIYNPDREEMVSLGSYPHDVAIYEETIPLEDTIAGEVTKTGQTFLVHNIFKEDKYKNKEKAKKLGFHSMMAIPIILPRFSIKDIDIKGVLQIYYKAEDKVFTPLEVEMAELLARRMSYVIARRRIKELQQFHLIKDKTLDHLFQRLARREGIKMKEIFNSVIPELVDIMKIQRCALFSVMFEQGEAILEAGYPESGHGIGQRRSVHEPYISVLVNQIGPFGEFEGEHIYPSHILIHNPKESRLLTPDIKHFLETQEIHSVLYIPLKVEEVVKYFLVFDAQAQHQRFTNEEIEILTFFGKELTKALRFEKVDDILHDFKNPAIAIAGFARRIKEFLKDVDYPSKGKTDQALEILLKESSRIQELALTLHGEGKESILDLTDVLRKRSLINEQALREMGRVDVKLVERGLEPSLGIRCFPFHIERVIDNLLNNASNAIPQEGGELSIKSYRRDPWAVFEITNSGQISEEERERCLLGEGKGRGLHITTRLIKHMGGKMEIEAKEGHTTFCITLPLAK